MTEHRNVTPQYTLAWIRLGECVQCGAHLISRLPSAATRHGLIVCYCPSDDRSASWPLRDDGAQVRDAIDAYETEREESRRGSRT